MWVIRKGKVKFFHSNPWRHTHMWRENVQHHSFIITALEGCVFLPAGTAAFLQGK
jgi:hypothetical protein